MTDLIIYSSSPLGMLDREQNLIPCCYSMNEVWQNSPYCKWQRETQVIKIIRATSDN